jgi:hypothetical protein
MSSSVQIADSVRTLDMSMPKYDDLKSYKASVENVPGLSVPGASISRGRVRVPSVERPQEENGGMPVSSFLPSMGKKSAEVKAAEKQPTGKISTPSYDF